MEHFKSLKEYHAVGEASTQYFYTAKTPKKIYEFNPDFKLIFIIRNPVVRAYSNYNREIQVWGESRSFEEIIDRYTGPSMYYTHLSRFLKFFPKAQMRIIILEKFIKNVDRYLKEICEFLEINPKFKFNPNKFTRNPSKMPISLRLQKLNKNFFYLNRREHFLLQAIRVGCRGVIDSINHLFYKSREFPKIKKSMKKNLKNYFHDEILKLEELIEEDLSVWK